MKDRFRKFMIGRYGVDQFNRFLLGVVLVAMIVSVITRNNILNLIAFLVLVITYLRMLSKNHAKRYRENNRYLNIQNRVLGFFRKQNYMAGQRKSHHIYRCPSCRQKIRIPKGKGRISITCPKCKTVFIKKS